MATFYLDPVGGNDANDGTTFANRWQTLTSGATAGRITSGDTIRVIASPDPVATTITATWPDGSSSPSNAISLSSNPNQLVQVGTGAWTATTNASSTTSTNRRTGNTSTSISVTASFTTGKAAYTSFTALNLSGRQQLTFWINMTAGAMSAGGDISLRLCSDTTGDVTVNTFPVPRLTYTSRWVPITVDFGSALGSSIQSIALYIEQDRGAQTFLLQQMTACNAPSNADCLTLNTLVGKNNSNDYGWYSLTTVSGTNLVLDFYRLSTTVNTSATVGQITARGYPGLGEAVTLYTLTPITLPSSIQSTTDTGATFGTVNDDGITISGGWNTTDMSTQTGETYISGLNYYGYGLAISGRSNITTEKISFTGFYNGIDIRSGSTNITVNGKYSGFHANAAVSVIGTAASPLTGINVNTDNLTGCTFGLYLQYVSELNSTITRIAGHYGTNSAQTGCGVALDRVNGSTFTIGTIYSGGANTNPGLASIFQGCIVLQNSANNVFSVTTLDGIPIPTFIRTSNTSNNRLIISNTTRTASASVLWGTRCSYIYPNSASSTILDALRSNDFYTFTTAPTSSGGSGSILIGLQDSTNTINWGSAVNNTAGSLSFTPSNSVIIGPPSVTSSSTLSYSTTVPVKIASVNGDPTDNRLYFSQGLIQSTTAVRHTASGISWGLTPSSSDINPPLTLQVAKIACNSGTLVTASVWVYRTSTSLVTRFVCPGGQIAGVSSDVTATASAAINTWEQLTITFTPSAQGVVELEVQCSGAAATAYVDDFTASQA